MFTAKEIRRKFLEYFEKNGHTIVDSSSLVPRDDPSLLFSNSGMVQFKQCFLGQDKREYNRATTAQKCLRVSGKHNDLENVGRTARHHTFFEMLGNFSFGDYFKEEAIGFAWNFITKELALPKDRLFVTVFRDDDEAFELWQKVTGIAPERIFRMGEKDNFWSMGDTGPCGPCSEIFIDQGEQLTCGPDCGIGKCDCDRFLEIWNLVFMQYEQAADGSRTRLPRPSIDTGMGLERVTAVCQGKFSNFDTDLFQGVIQCVAKEFNIKYAFSAPDTNENDTALRVIADHSRSAAFLICDGILPSNEGRGYVLRRLMRRALRFGKLVDPIKFDAMDSILPLSVAKVIDVMGEDYPDLLKKADFIKRVVYEEEQRFRLTLNKGLALLEEEMDKGLDMISGEVAFKLYDTFGFPLDIINDVAQKRGISVDEAGYTQQMQEQRKRARAAWKGSGEVDLLTRFKSLLDTAGLETEFCGYTCLEAGSRIVGLLDVETVPVEKLTKGQKGFVVTGKTPFYGASGGQVGDTGLLEAPAGNARITDTLKPHPKLVVHQIEVTSGEVLLDQEVLLKVTEGVRLASARNHTCTHLLHTALQEVLGKHVQQAGSLVGPDRLRFDFSHFAAMSDEELTQVERRVNEMILSNFPVESEEMGQEEALDKGATALFGEKYGKIVRVISVGSQEEKVSVELCGGTHLQYTGQAGLFMILSESGIAAGVRRIEAATGWNSQEVFVQYRKEVRSLAGDLKSRPGELCARVDLLQKEVKSLRKELSKAQIQSNTNVMDALRTINGISVLTSKFSGMSVKAMRDLMDDIRSKLPSGIACIASDEGDRANILIYVSKDLHARFTAPDLIKTIAVAIDGSGGGRPDMAQAGGTKVAGIDAAIKLLENAIS